MADTLPYQVEFYHLRLRILLPLFQDPLN